MILDYDDISYCPMGKKFFHNTNDNQDKPLVLIAGGAGFVGSYLCELLLQQNCCIVCLDNLITGTKKNLENCLNNSDFLFIKQDLSQPVNQEIGQPNYIFHLAGLEAYLTGVDLSLDTLLANVSGTISLLKLAEKAGSKFLLGSSQRVFQARISTQRLIDYFGKGAMGEIASFSEAKRSAEALTTEYTNKGVDARIVRLAWVYGPRMNLSTGGILARMIKQAVSDRPIEIPGGGSKRIQPTFVSDVVYGLSKAMFSSGTAGKIYSLVNPKEETFLSFAHQLQGLVGQDLKIEYVAEEKVAAPELEQGLFPQKELGWQPKIELSDGLKQTLTYFQKRIKKPTENKPDGEKKITKEKTREVGKKTLATNYKGLFSGLVLLVLMAILYLPGSLVCNSFLGIRNLHSAHQTAVLGDFTKTASLAKTAGKEFGRANEGLRLLEPVFTLVGQNRLQYKIETYLTIGLQAGEGLEKLGDSAQDVVEISRAIFQDQTADIGRLTSEINTNLDSVYQQLSYLEAQVKSKPESRQFLEKFDGELVDKLSASREIVLKVKEGSRLLPDLVGLYGRRTYLVLFQNNMELRPTGGFIGSFALVIFEEGRLIDFQVVDVYSADGQLKGHVEPPAVIHRYLGEAGWYLRDSNFNPDFPTSALQAAWFLEKEMGRKVDGVVAVDLFLAQRILQATGSVNLTDYQEEINSRNLFERAEYYAEVNFFPGSSQKKDFLGALANALFEKVRQTDEKQWLTLSQAIYQSLKSKDLLIFLNNQEGARVLADLGWSGGLRSVGCEVEAGQCLVDYLMIVESNFGVNKVNYFMKRNLIHQISFDSDGTIRENLRIDYHNQSQSEIFPAGRYKNYLRILTPFGTVLEKVIIDGKELDKNKIDEIEIAGRTSFGFLVEVPIQTKKIVEISYHLADKLSLKPGNRFLLYLQKQPGIEDKVFNFWLIPPAKMGITSIQPESSLASGMLVFTPQFDQDLVFEVELGR